MIAALEEQRLARQASLDGQKSFKDRNRWGQFATPPPLADDITSYALTLHDDSKPTFLEPSLGTGAFYSSLLRVLAGREVEALGVELDSDFASTARQLWQETGLRVIEKDFTNCQELDNYKASLLLANPPYVRHHHLDSGQKVRLVERCSRELGLRPSGLSGLYLYFVLLSHRYLARDAVCAWLIPSEFMDTNYGRTLRDYLTSKVTLRRVHRFDSADVQFDDALVTSAVVVFQNRLPQAGDVTDFTYGGTVMQPRMSVAVNTTSLRPHLKWIRYFHDTNVPDDSAGPVLGNMFRIRRGIATGANSFFILPKDRSRELGIRPEHLTPVLPGPKYLPSSIVESDSDGYPDIDRKLALINCSLPEDQISDIDSALAAYLGSASSEIRQSYLVRMRKPWYRQERRDPAPFICTYMGRGLDEQRPFRFILNRSQAIATNMFLMLYPTGALAKYIEQDAQRLAEVHRALLSLTAADLRDGGRVYGGGLHKIEPKELAALNARALTELAPELESAYSIRQPALFD